MNRCEAQVQTWILLSVGYPDRKQVRLVCAQSCRHFFRAKITSSTRPVAYAQTGRSSRPRCAGAGVCRRHTMCDLVTTGKLPLGGETESNSVGGFRRGDRR
jgi:hypothetical protein